MQYVIPLVAFNLLGSQDDTTRQIQELLEQLRSDRIEMREDAEGKLVALGELALAFVQNATRDADPNFAALSHRIERRIYRAQLTPRLLQKMPNVDDRLCGKGLHPWTEVFLEAIDHSKHRGIRSEDLAPLAVRALRGAKTSREKMRVCGVIGNGYLVAVIPEVRKLLNDPDAEVRMEALKALRELDAWEAVEEVIGLLKDQDPDVRSEAIVVLAFWHATDSLPGLVVLLRDSDTRVRLDAAESLGWMGNRETIPPLAALLQDPDKWIRITACRALSRIGHADAIPHLRPLISDEAVCGPALRALAKLGDTDATNEFIRFFGAGRGRNRRDDVIALAGIAGRAAIPALIEALDDPDDVVSGNAMYSLRYLRAKEAIPRLLKSLNSEDPHVRGVAAYTLASLGAKESLPVAMELARDSNWYIRREGAMAIAALRELETVPELLRLLNDRNPDVRMVATRGLVDLEVNEAVPKLEKRLHSRAAGSWWRGYRIPKKNGNRDDWYWAQNRGRYGEFFAQLCVASALCEMGSLKGVPTILEDARDLSTLNRLRQPDLFKRLSRVTRGTFEGTGHEILARIAEETQLSIDFPEQKSQKMIWWLSQQRRLFAKRTLSQVIEDVLPDRFEVILEPGRIRIVDREESRQFWCSWWESKQRKRPKK